MFNTNTQNWFGVNHDTSSMVNHSANINSNQFNQMNGNHHHHQPHSNMSNQNIYLRKRSVSNSNPALDRPAPAPDIPIQVQYEVAVPFVSAYRHTPYHSLWDLHEWLVISVRSRHYTIKFISLFKSIASSSLFFSFYLKIFL